MLERSSRKDVIGSIGVPEGRAKRVYCGGVRKLDEDNTDAEGGA